MRISSVFFSAILILGNLTGKAQNWYPNGTSLFYNDGNVGIGTSSPENKLDIRTTQVLEGINILHNDQKTLKIHGGSLHAGAYNYITQDGDAGIIFGASATPFAFVLAPWANATSGLRMDHNGNVGIGTATPTAPLSVSTTNTNTYSNISSFKNNTAVNSWISVANNAGALNLGVGGSSPNPYIWSSTGNLFIGDEGNSTLYVNGMANGNVGIGTTDTKGYKFAVNGSAIFTKVVVKPYPSWPDYVFHTNYRLRPLSEVEQYIKQYHHLPEVTSAEEVEKNGLDVGDNQATLLKKIEELTLYVIEHNKIQQAQQQQLQDLSQRVNILQKENEQLKMQIQIK
jgi:hypothetical protein